MKLKLIMLQQKEPGENTSLVMRNHNFIGSLTLKIPKLTYLKQKNLQKIILKALEYLIDQ